MLSFQILDDGQVQSFALEGHSVEIGTGSQCGIRLHSDGVVERHARVEPLRRDGATLYKIVDLGSAGGTRVNGELVAQVALAVGDRIEIGGATLVLGKRILRPATPADVLAGGVSVRLRRSRPQAPTRAWLPIAVGAAVVLLAGAVFVLRDASPPSALLRVRDLLAQGDHETAAQVVETVRRDWAGSDAARQRVLAGYAADVARQRELLASLEADVENLAASISSGQQIDGLREREAAARDDVERAAVRLTLARLHDLRLRAASRSPSAGSDVALVTTPAPPPDVAPVPDPRTVGDEPTAKPQDVPSDSPSGGKVAPVAERLQRVRDVLDGGDLRLASELLDALGTESTDEAASLRQALADKVGKTAQVGLQQAEELVALGRSDAASALLRRISTSFPAAQRADLEQRAVAFAAIVPPPPPPPAGVLADPLGDLLAAVEAAEKAWNDGDFVAAQRRFAEAAKQVASRDAAFAADLEARSADCKLVSVLHATITSRLRTSSKPEVRLADDRKARLVDCDAFRLHLTAEAGAVVVTWFELPAAAVDTILTRVDPPAEAYLGAAVLAVAAGDQTLAEQRLLNAARKDAATKGKVDDMLARVRGERVPANGYAIEGGKFTSPALSPLVRELEGKLAAALGHGDHKAREGVLSDVLARGPEQLEAVIQVLRRQQRGLVERLGKHPFKKNWERVAAERGKLDAARAHALELIFDEELYFYPYKPPAVSSEQATKYFAVQREVDARIDAVRDIWQKSSLEFTIPDVIAADLERLRWVTEVLDGFGERSTGLLARAQWVLALPEQRVLGIQTFCRDAQEVADARLFARIAKLNGKRGASLAPGEREELQVTNAYRLMMGRRPLVVDLRVLAAARAHCDEMERLGYFGHISPVAERRTPYDRMRLAGYGHGGSENIATNDSATGAHSAWLHSSGHHRNILGEAHTEFACGQRGRLWTQNFGAGRDFERDLPE